MTDSLLRDPAVTSDGGSDHAATIDPTATADPSAIPDAITTADPPRGLSRRALLGRTGAVAGTALLGSALAATATAAAPAAAATRTRIPPTPLRRTPAPGLPSARAAAAGDALLVDREIVDLAALLQAGTISSVELTTAYLDRIATLDGPTGAYASDGTGYHAFVRVTRDAALAQAAAADARLAAARRDGATAPYLCGIPLGISDAVGIAGQPASFGSPAWAANVAGPDAVAVARLRDLGAVLLGHTTQSPFGTALGGNVTGNAWDPRYVPGGASQGAGCAPIARLAAATLGADTNGSLVWPAAINGASAIKPSLGLGSVAGAMPLNPTSDVLGPLARSGRDAALVMNALIGHDPDADLQTLAAPTPFPVLAIAPRVGSKPLRGLVVGIPRNDLMRRQNYDAATNAVSSTIVGDEPRSTFDADHRAAFDRVVAELEALGATVKPFAGLDDRDPAKNPYTRNATTLATIDGTKVGPRDALLTAARAETGHLRAIAAYATAHPDDAAALTARYGRVPGGAATGAKTLAAALTLENGITNGVRRAAEVRRRTLATAYREALRAEGIDVLLAMSIGQEVGRRNPRNADDGVPLCRDPQIASDLSWPVVSFPVAATSAAGLPISVQLWGPRFSEPRLVQAMVDYQARHPEHHRRRPADPTFGPARDAAQVAADAAASAAAPPATAVTADAVLTERAVAR